MTPVPPSATSSSVSTPAFFTSSVETRTVALARFYAWIASVIHLLREKDCRGDRRQKEYSNALGQFFRSATAQLVNAIRQFAGYWHPEEFEVDIHSTSLVFRKRFVFNMSRSVTSIDSFPLLSRTYLAIDAHSYIRL